MIQEQEDGTFLNTDTGEVHDEHPNGSTTVTGALVPTQVSMGRELEILPADFAGLATLFAEQEPAPMEVARWILEPDQMDVRDPEESTRAILARILAADTAEQVLATRDVVHAKDILGEPLLIDTIKWQRSDYQQGSSCYVVMSGKRLQDESPVTVTCGGRNVMMQLLKLQHIGALPARMRITQAAKQTANGYLPLWLEPA
jgi:hypothetical protein